MEKVKKYISIVIILLLCIPLGVLISRETAELYEASPLKGIYALVSAVISFTVAFYFSVITHEGGHLIFGLLSGYGFSSFRISGIMLIKLDGKMKLKKFKLPGTGGQCLMCPPEPRDGKFPVMIYNLGGVIVNLFFAAVSFALYYLLDFVPIISLTLFMIGIFSAYFAVTNGIPISAGGISNDGMNAYYLSKDRTAATVFRNQLLMNAAQASGVRIADMPSEWFEIPEGADRGNVHIASMAVCKTSRTLDSGDTVAGEAEISELLNSNYNLAGLHRSLLVCDLISSRLVNSPGADVSALITPDVNKLFTAMKSFPSVIRTQYIIALLSEGDEKKAEKILSNFDKITKNYPYLQDALSEREFMLKALEKFKNKQKTEAE